MEQIEKLQKECDRICREEILKRNKQVWINEQYTLV